MKIPRIIRKQQYMRALCLFILLFQVVSFHAQTLNLTSTPQYVRVGDLDIPGSSITVEALVKFTGGVNIVSKHTGPPNVNYLMRIGTFEITTTTQFYYMVNPYASSMLPNTWYHVAGTYDGSFVRYYVNGCLIVEQAASGTIIQNNLITAIGNISTAPNAEQFYGEIDEVRIWNVARTAAELTANMFDLPNPTTYPNLKAYYKFDGNLINSQGNATYNGIWVGTPEYGVQPLPSVIPTFSFQTVTPTSISCFGVNDGTIAIAATGNNLQYSIDNVNWQAANTFTGLAPGNYTVYTRTPEGCVITENNITIDPKVQINASASNGGSYCPGAAIQLTGSSSSAGTLSYSWTGPNGYTSVSQNPVDATAAGIYNLTVTSGGCSSPISSTTVEIKPTPSATATNTGPYCAGQNLQLNGSTTATGTNSYAWTGPAGFTSALQNPSNATLAGNYNLTVTSDGCLSSIASTTITVNPIPSSTANNSGPYCAGQTIQLSGATNSPANNTFSWTGPNGYNSLAQNPSDATTAGNYNLTVSSNGCSSSASSTTVVIKPIPTGTATNSGPYCSGEAMQLTGTNTSAGVATFAWSGPNSYVSVLQNPTDATVSGLYNLIITIDGCQSLPISTTIVISPTPIANAGNTGPYCEGETMQLTGNSSVNGTTTYAWTGTNGFSSATQNPTVTAPGTYSLVITANGCVSLSASTNVVINQNPTVTASNTGPYYVGQVPQLNAETTIVGNASFQWIGPAGFTSSSQNPSTALLEGVYTVLLTDVNGCTATSSTIIEFSNVAYVIVPNIFTPNGDGKNDVFKILQEGIKDLNCVLFNRWGEKMYEIASKDGTWDGKVNGEEVADGVYFYKLEASDYTGKTYPQKGFVHINR